MKKFKIFHLAFGLTTSHLNNVMKIKKIVRFSKIIKAIIKMQ